MLSLWTTVSEADIASYAAALMLPPHLAHLRLAPCKFADQAVNSDGRESLRLVYVGEGRLEEFRLAPMEHALPLLEMLSPGLDTSRVRLPRDDAVWSWSASGKTLEQMRIYFAPTSRALNESIGRPVGQEAYVSVSRGHVFIGRPIIECYLEAWLRRLGVHAAAIHLEMPTAGSSIALAVGPIGGELLVDDDATADDLIRFAGLERPLAQVKEFSTADGDAPASPCGVLPDGVYLPLAELVSGK